MSYLFDQSTNTGFFDGDFGAGATFQTPITIAFWYKWTAWNDYATPVNFADNNIDYFPGITTSTSSTTDMMSAGVYGTGYATASTTYNSTGSPVIWVPVIVIAQATGTYASIYQGDQSFTNAIDNPGIGSVNFRYLRVGRAFGGLPENHWDGYIADVGIWNTALDASARAAILAGDAYTTVANASLKGWWRFRNSGTQSDVSGKGGPDLTLSGTASYQASENPDVDPPGTTKYLKFLTQPAAVGQTVQGVVFESPTASPETTDIVGAKVGEFTGASVAAGTGDDTGKGVVLVDVADFGGGALAADEVVIALVRNATDGTGLESGVIVEI